MTPRAPRGNAEAARRDNDEYEEHEVEEFREAAEKAKPEDDGSDDEEGAAAQRRSAARRSLLRNRTFSARTPRPVVRWASPGSARLLMTQTQARGFLA